MEDPLKNSDHRSVAILILTLGFAGIASAEPELLFQSDGTSRTEWDLVGPPGSTFDVVEDEGRPALTLRIMNGPVYLLPKMAPLREFTLEVEAREFRNFFLSFGIRGDEEASDAEPGQGDYLWIYPTRAFRSQVRRSVERDLTAYHTYRMVAQESTLSLYEDDALIAEQPRTSQGSGRPAFGSWDGTDCRFRDIRVQATAISLDRSAVRDADTVTVRIGQLAERNDLQARIIVSRAGDTVDTYTCSLRFGPDGELATVPLSAAVWQPGQHVLDVALLSDDRLIAQEQFIVHKWLTSEIQERLTRLEQAIPSLTRRAVHDTQLRIERIHEELPRIRYVQDLAYIIEQLDAADARLDRPSDACAGETGFIERVFRSRIDGSLQPYVVFVPPGYDPDRRYPLVIMLHGAVGDQWEMPVCMELRSHPERSEYFILSPLARGMMGYASIAEADIWQALEEIEAVYSIDPDRISATGFSMGGGGSWHLGLRYPDRFAAIAPQAGWADLRLLENATCLTSYIYHGDHDRTVPPGFAQAAAKYLDHLEYRYTYTVLPHTGHAIVTAVRPMEAVIEDLLPCRRTDRPEQVTYTTDRLRYNTAYWVRVDALNPRYHYGRIQARVVKGPSEHIMICVKREGIDAYSLLLDRAPVDSTRTIKVVDGQDLVYDGPFRPELHLPQQEARAELTKRHGLSGPIEDVFYDPFLYVYGTGAQADSNRVQAQRATDWGRVKQSFSVKADTALTSEDIAHHHLILYGQPAGRGPLSRLLDGLPLSLSEESITINGRSFSGDDLGLQMIYPNPLNPERYVVLHWGVQGPYIDQEWDLIVFRHSTERDVSYEMKVRFDNHWRLPEREIIGETSSTLSTLASLRAEALLLASGADVALVPKDGPAMPLKKGPITTEDILARTEGEPIFTFQIIGKDLLTMLEHGLEQDHPFEIAGAAYTVDTTRTAGQRVAHSSISGDKGYTVAVEAITAILADRTLGQAVDYALTEISDTDAVIRYVKRTLGQREGQEQR